ncbi:crossover junction endodeoxyribonuclease RuvC [Candidatus Dojkabacteria bacterium]|uniref:Crossover junction endodeoxyribonuclease RuvC n=1 Tax=Candidatus Dojkabacteria bacterium TaxID=2099670 RepID=A0A955KVJ3_9BACT|nr:crossover junction endodeoxyribonuclease RuvC [Candidatus Dojkabacteria bacterium]MCB9790642.1 crossover junction endodeoxyribonuclease RuvC [Candidatus Nomurabacteria bacterium]
MRILGIDPGFALVGWGVIEFHSSSISLIDYGVLSTDKSLEHSDRLLEIFKDMRSLLEDFNPDCVGIETLLFHRNITTAMGVSEARGVILMAARLRDKIRIQEVTPLQVKNSVSGYGRATKKQMQENVRIICGLDAVPEPDDAADAIAVAICAHDLISSSQLS